jgi:hypothetical protein
MSNYNNKLTDEMLKKLKLYKAKTSAYKWLHEESNRYYTKLNKYLTNTNSILSGSIGIFAGGVSTAGIYDPEIFSPYVGYIVMVISFITGGLTKYIENSAYDKRVTLHKQASIEYNKLYNYIDRFLDKYKYESSNVIEIIEFIYSSYDDLYLRNINIDPPDCIKEKYEKNFGCIDFNSSVIGEDISRFNYITTNSTNSTSSITKNNIISSNSQTSDNFLNQTAIQINNDKHSLNKDKNLKNNLLFDYEKERLDLFMSNMYS